MSVKYEFQHVVSLHPHQGGRPGYSFIIKVDLRKVGKVYKSSGGGWHWEPEKYSRDDWMRSDGGSNENLPLLPCGHSRKEYNDCSQAVCALLAFTSFGSNEGVGGPFEVQS